MKRLISIALTLVMLLSSFAAITVSADTTTETTYANTVELTQENIYDYFNLNGGNDEFTFAENTKYVLTEDITLDSATFEGHPVITTAATAMLDGDEHSIYYTSTNDKRFSLRARGGVIQNVNFGSDESRFGTYYSFMGTDAGKADTLTEWNNVNFYLASSNPNAYKDHFSGLARSTNGNHTFKNCLMDLRMGTSPTELWSNRWDDSFMAGFIGRVESGTVEFENCGVNGHLYTRTGNGAAFVGLAKGESNVTFKNCVNNMTYYTNAATKDKNTNPPSSAAFCGVYTSGTVKLENCVNYGTIRGESVAAGLVNVYGGNVELINCENYGDVSSNGKAGGIVTHHAYNANATVTVDNCINLGNVTNEAGTTATGGIVGATDNTYCTPVVKNSYSFGTAELVGAGEATVDDLSKNVATACTTLAEAVDALNNASDVKYVLGAAGEAPIVVATPTLRAVQNTTPDAGLQSVRFIGVFGMDDVDYIGFKVVTKVGDVSKDRGNRYCQNVYVSVKGAGETYTATDLGGKYIFAYAFDKVPTGDAAVTFEVIPFAVKGETEYLGASYTVVYQNGECTSFALTEVAA